MVHFKQGYAAVKKYDFPWGILNILISQQSPIDLPALAISDAADAYAFILSYGYDLDDIAQREEVIQIQEEACVFIQKYFLESLSRKLAIPDNIKSASAMELLLLASQHRNNFSQKWACAVLRVMHTMAHASTNDLSFHFFPVIQRQLLDRYARHIHRDKDEKIYLGQGDERISLVEFNIKTTKDKDSTLMKLLHKAENVAADIFDRIGFRFVTQDKLDALLVVKYLREKNVVAFPNVKPSRSVNTLINTQKFRKTVSSLYKRYEKGELAFSEFEQFLRHDVQFEDTLSSRQIQSIFRRNPHTSHEYRSIQFTVRNLIRIPNPLYIYRKAIDPEKVSQEEWRTILHYSQPYYKFFFPYEVQVLDIETHEHNRAGRASYDKYKLKQMNAARQRILGNLIPIERNQKE